MTAKATENDRRETALQALDGIESCAAAIKDHWLKQLLFASACHIIAHVIRQETDHRAA